MRTMTVVLALLMCVGCAGVTSAVSTNDQFNKEGQTVEFTQRFLIGLDLPPDAIKELSPEQLVAIYTTLAEKGFAPGGSLTFSPSLEFHQTQGTDGRSEAQLSAELKAQIEATMRDLITNPVP